MQVRKVQRRQERQKSAIVPISIHVKGRISRQFVASPSERRHKDKHRACISDAEHLWSYVSGNESGRGRRVANLAHCGKKSAYMGGRAGKRIKPLAVQLFDVVLTIVDSSVVRRQSPSVVAGSSNFSTVDKAISHVVGSFFHDSSGEYSCGSADNADEIVVDDSPIPATISSPSSNQASSATRFSTFEACHVSHNTSIVSGSCCNIASP